MAVLGTTWILPSSAGPDGIFPDVGGGGVGVWRQTVGVADGAAVSGAAVEFTGVVAEIGCAITGAFGSAVDAEDDGAESGCADAGGADAAGVVGSAVDAEGGGAEAGRLIAGGGAGTLAGGETF